MSTNQMSKRFKMATYTVQRPPTQHPFGCGRCITPVSLQVPCDISPAQLWEHLRYRIDLGGVDPHRAASSWSRAICRRLAGIPPVNKESNNGEHNHLRYINALFRHTERVGCEAARQRFRRLIRAVAVSTVQVCVEQTLYRCDRRPNARVEKKERSVDCTDWKRGNVRKVGGEVRERQGSTFLRAAA